MVSIQLTNIKGFMSSLLLSNSFDRFLLTEASITTGTTIIIDGHFHPGFYTEAELSEHDYADGDYIYWAYLKPFVLDIIKGKHTPLQFQFTFCLNSSNIRRLLKLEQLSFVPEVIRGLYLNIRYDHGNLTCTTASSLSIFTTDRSLDEAWDRMVQKYFTKIQLDYEIL